MRVRLFPSAHWWGLSEKLDHTLGVFTVEQHVRGRWACRDCETLNQTSIPAQVINKNTHTAGQLANVIDLSLFFMCAGR